MSDLEVQDQVRALETAHSDPEVRELVSPVVAAGFGILPLGEAGDALRVAHVEGGAPGRFEALERVLGRPVRPVPFQEAIVQTFLSRMYLADRAVNFPTFRDPAFLEDDHASRRLGREKEDDPGAGGSRLPADRLVCLDASLRSELVDLDRREGTPEALPRGIQALEPRILFRTRGDQVTVFLDEPLPDGASLLLQEDLRYGGIDHEHGIRTALVETLPHLVHPTEIQIPAIDEDGTVAIYCYDRTDRVRPGTGPATFETTYHFLSLGHRMRRRLVYRVRRVKVVARGRILCEPTSAESWSPDDLRRWLAFDPVD